MANPIWQVVNRAALREKGSASPGLPIDRPRGVLEKLAVPIEVGAHLRVEIETSACLPCALRSQARAKLFVVQKRLESIGESFRIAGRDKEARSAVLDLLRYPADGGRHDGSATGERFQHGERE